MHSALSGFNNGVMATAPLIGVKALNASDWMLPLPTILSGVGLLLTLATGLWMSRRPKMPFIVLPGLASAAVCLAMTLAPTAAPFLLLLGLFNLLEIVTRPAMTAVIRANYPVEARGWVTGTQRQWSAGAFLGAATLSGLALDRYGSWAFIQTLIALAAVAQAGAFLAFNQIRARPDEPAPEPEAAGSARARESLAVMFRDRRFLRYVGGTLLFGVGGMMYVPYVAAYLARDLGLGYAQCVLLGDAVPSVVSILTLARLGAWLDRTNPLLAWALIRLSWGLDPLVMALAPFWPPGAFAIATSGRLLRGLAMNGSWVLYWQLGTNYFTNRRDLTTVYMGLNTSMTGVLRIIGPLLGSGMTALTSRRGALVVGGTVVLLSAWHAWSQARADRVDGRYPTFAERERLELAMAQGG